MMPHVSPSQVATWRKCKRKWAYSRVRPRTTNKYAEFGTRVHTYREHWLRYGLPPDSSTAEGRCALAGLELLPMPGTAYAELPLNFTYQGVKYVGTVDVLSWRPPFAHTEDHKTCGSFDYALTAEQLFDDPQRIIYSYWAAWVFRADHVLSTWHYLRRKPPKCQPVRIVEDAQTIAARFINLHYRDGLPIVQSAGIPPEYFPRSLDHCNAYGGCPYADECLQNVSALPH